MAALVFIRFYKKYSLRGIKTLLEMVTSLATSFGLQLKKDYLAQHVVSHKETVKPIWLVSLIFLRFYLIVLK